MDSFFLGLAFVTAGIALLSAIINISAGLYKEADAAELIFGFLSLSLFIFLLIPPVGFILIDKAPYELDIKFKRIFIWAYYILLAHFIQSYTGYRKKYIMYPIYFFALSAYIIMATAKRDASTPLWLIPVDITFGLILYLGVAGGIYQIRNNKKKEAKWLLVAMSLYGVLYICSLFFRVTGVKLFFPFHLNMLFFLTAMGIRLRVYTLEKYRLEKALHLQDLKWNLLVQNMQLIMVELDTGGVIKYINPFGIKKLGYASQNELVGKNWFELVVVPEEFEERKSYYRESMRRENLLLHLTNQIKTKAGVKLVISWTNVQMAEGVLSIGMDNTELTKSFKQVQQLKDELEKENLAPKNEKVPLSDHDIIGESETILYTLQKAKQVAVTNAGVLLMGETGSGKELLANLIHQKSYRCNAPFIKINCAALPSELIESELFGHEKGSFTGALVTRKGKFELANGGTVFLDEIGELPLALQAKLLRVLQNGEFERIGGHQVIKVDVRIIAATNRNLAEETRAGKFREDLFYRLNVFPIIAPPLRQRKEDIPLLVTDFIKKFAAKENKTVTQISKADMGRLCAYSWPGNVRELINVLERSIIESDGPVLNLKSWQYRENENDANEEVYLLGEVEKAHLLKVLKESNWKINGDEGAAAKLGLHPNTLRSRLKKLQIERDRDF